MKKIGDIMNYEGFGIRHIGASHIQKEIVCQDSVQYHQDLQCAAAAVSDGHGGQPYFRSDRGSAFAVQISCRYITEFLQQHPDFSGEESLQPLIRQILQEWYDAVKKDLLAEPFTESELERVTERNLPSYLPFSEKQRTDIPPEEFPHSLFQAYGATLICMGFCENYGFALHIGDGKCVAVYPDGRTDEPVPWDENCHLNLCTSICDTDAEQEFRFYVWKKSEMPVAVFAASDGIDDSFAERLHNFYLHVAIEFISCGLRKGVQEIAKQLPGISERGSQDDVSVCGMIDMFALQEAKTVIQRKAESLQRNAMLSAIAQKLTELQFRCDKIKRILNACPEEEQEKIKRNEEKLEMLSSEMEKLLQQKAELEKEEKESELSEPVLEEEPESEVSASALEEEPESENSASVPEEEPESEDSASAPEEEPESEDSASIPEEKPESEVSDSDNKAILISEEDW